MLKKVDPVFKLPKIAGLKYNYVSKNKVTISGHDLWQLKTHLQNKGFIQNYSKNHTIFVGTEFLLVTNGNFYSNSLVLYLLTSELPVKLPIGVKSIHAQWQAHPYDKNGFVNFKQDVLKTASAKRAEQRSKHDIQLSETFKHFFSKKHPKGQIEAVRHYIRGSEQFNQPLLKLSPEKIKSIDRKKISKQIAALRKKAYSTSSWKVEDKLYEKIEQLQSLTECNFSKIQNLEKIVKKAKIDIDLLIFRGTKEKYSVGKTYTSKCFISTSLDEAVANGFCDGTLLQFQVPKGHSGLYVGLTEAPGNCKNEKEVILPKGTKFKVLEKQRVKLDYRFIDAYKCKIIL